MDEEDTSKASMVEVPEVDASFPMRSVAIGPVYFNPVVSLIATCSLWGLAGYCMVGIVLSRAFGYYEASLLCKIKTKLKLFVAN